MTGPERRLLAVSPELPGSGDATAAWAAETLRAAGLTGNGLYVVTDDGGAREALAFWAAALDTGFAFANPAAFPWTLANSATGRISQQLGITGPCSTYVGGDEALAQAELDAAADVEDGVVDAALVVGLRGGGDIGPDGGPVRVHLTARVVCQSPVNGVPLVGAEE